MPYESLEELKIIFNGDQNFQRMCEAAVRTKMVDVFLEEDDVNDDASHANETVGDALLMRQLVVTEIRCVRRKLVLKKI